jgi:hypothetical protein
VAGGSDETRYFFLHLQKTAGTSLGRRLRVQFPPVEVYPWVTATGLRPVLDLDNLRTQFERRRSDLRLIMGHFPICLGEVLDTPLTTFTVLREPVERVLSALRRRSERGEQAAGQNLEDIYADPAVRTVIDNHMVKMLSLEANELTSLPIGMPFHCDDERLAAAKHNLEIKVDLFGLQEEFEDFCVALAGRYGWSLGEPQVVNRSQPATVSPDLRRRVEDNNRYDVELYRFASNLWRARARPPAHDEGARR